VLAIHDQSFPSTPDEDVGRGSPHGRGARALLDFSSRLGFDGLQLGPQGLTTLVDPSPYDGALLAKSPLSIALATLQEAPEWAEISRGLLEPLVAARPAGDPERVQYAYAWQAARCTLAALHQRFASSPRRSVSLHQRFAAYRRRHHDRLAGDARFEALADTHGTDDWRRWPVDARVETPAPGDSEAQYAEVVERFFFGQFVLHEQHQALRRVAAAAVAGPLALYGDLQIGFSHRDLWSRRGLFRDDYLLGAPPSRTNPAGQPWGYPVLDPNHYFVDGASGRSPGPVLDFLTMRVDHLLAEVDGLRIDHPHGLVCPWVYAAGDADPAAAVARGARLLCSPNLADHPGLAALAIPAAAQISQDPGIARYADDWVRALDEAQITRYGVLFDAVMARVAAAGRQARDVVCEVLSTWPFPLRAVMQRYGLGRFCVTQKADLARADDVYRGENASARDWIMLGNHDTPPIWRLAEAWQGTAAGGERAAYLAARLAPEPVVSPTLRGRLARWFAEDPRHLCQGMFAELFVGPARRVSIFFADLFGLRETYNRPGVVDSANWTLRLASDFAQDYRRRVAGLGACNLPLALVLALAARRDPADHPAGAPARAPPHPEIAARLIGAARALTPSLDPAIIDWLNAALA
jgi:4-alpha-glucanotransferase